MTESRTIAVVAAVAASCALPAASASARDLVPEQVPGDVEGCVGLACEPASSPHAVPEAQGIAPRVAGPNELRQQRRPGFYEFGGGTLIGDTAVAYVVPMGRGDEAPPSVQLLPSYQALASINAFERGTSVILGAGVSEFTPRASAAASRKLRSGKRSSRRRAIARAAAYSDCPGGWFCIWEDRDYQDRMLKFQDTGYWQNLGNYGFNDNADSMANKRGGDSLLAEHTGGGGDRYCYDSYSAASNLGGFGDDASSVYLSTSDGRC